MRFLIVALSVLGILASTDAAKADRRVAFVVGNGAYKNVAQLPKPPVDAKAMAAVLRNVGFDVVEGTNLTRDKMTEKLLDFGKKAQGADVAVFFYAGHGIAISATNYLLPIDADIKSEMDVKLGAAINIDLTLDQTMSDAKVKLVFLDACRDNPFAAKIKSNSATRSVSVQTGLAEMKSGEGTLIAFATGPGQTALDGQEGTNSPFTRALIAHITTPGVEIQQAMTEVRAQVNEETNKGQLPWGHTNLIGSVYLNPVAAPAPGAAASSSGPAPAAVASTSSGSDVELEFWRSVKESNKPEELNAYLTNYPNGQFKSLALARIASLENGPSTATRNLTTGIDPATFTEEASQTTEDQIGLDKARQALRNITEGNCPLYLIRARTLHRYLRGLTNANAQRQYYLTDVVEALSRDGREVRTVTTTCADPEYDLLCSDVTRPMDLALLEGLLASARGLLFPEERETEAAARVIAAGR